MKKSMKKKESGGLVEEKAKNVSDRTPASDPTMKDSKDKKDSFKKGGVADGKKSKGRLDKKARGGGVGGHSPFSKAMSVDGRPGGKYAGGTWDKEDD